MKKRVERKKSAGRPKIVPGYQWGEPLRGNDSLVVSRVGEELEIVAAVPSFLSGDHPSDLVQQYQLARKRQSKQLAGKDCPHVQFANAQTDNKLIEFVRRFGPVTCKSCQREPSADAIPLTHDDLEAPIQVLMRARQDLQELRNEQRIYQAALGLLIDLEKPDADYDFNTAKTRIATIGLGIQDWRKQRDREQTEKGRDCPPLWNVRESSIQRITALAEANRDPLLTPKLDARIVLCELVNIFPSLAFPNPLEMHSYIRFGVRPILYGILRRELLYPRETGICANTQCRAFFEIQRAGQHFCDADCSQRHRQRLYWKSKGKARRKKRAKRSDKN